MVKQLVFAGVFLSALLFFTAGASGVILGAASFIRGESAYDTKTVTTESGWWLWKETKATVIPAMPGAKDVSALGTSLFLATLGGFLLLCAAVHLPLLIALSAKAPAKVKVGALNRDGLQVYSQRNTVPERVEDPVPA